MPHDLPLLLDLAQACRDILEFAQEMDYPAFVRDRRTQSAVIHQFLVIGEAAKQLSDGFKATHPEMPWNDMARMRDKLIHHYREVKLRVIWDAIQGDIPRLLASPNPLVPGADAPR
ncbi:MAG TPA: DUF86 domain-containing protein [Planctomycetota bacterium]|nr:DUF86 domain-containing protein [Planctomycetota bacterium]HRR80379.1 DUF86 domain-containing protein [Planctomycetota bacterium]HRT95868.1 DUF86 domain-containing protein [Planctomycetota bacterium]